MPKQLLRLTGQRTMIQQTLDRCRDLAAADCTWVVTNQVQAGRTAAQLPELAPQQILAEPCGRNTAPCVGLAAVRLLHSDPDATMLVLPADHVIQPVEQFVAAVRRAAEIVEREPQRLVLFGVTPAFPATGYGYIERGRLEDSQPPMVYEVAGFREKPEQAIAEEYLRAGRFYWNCGIFCWKAQTILDLLQRYEPALSERLERIADGYRNDTAEMVVAAEFPLMNSISIDYAVLERADSVAVIEAPFQWDDAGSWLSVPRLNGRDSNGNTIDGSFCGIDTRDCIVRSSDEHLIATLGVQQLVIVHTPDATLVAAADQSERIREILTELEKRQSARWL